MYKIIVKLKFNISLWPPLLEMRLFLGILFCICYGVKADLRSFYKDFEIVPDVLDESGKVAEQILTVSYGDDNLINGNEYTPTYCMQPPTIHPPMNHDSNGYYTLMHFTPDWISRKNPSFRHLLMWLVTNIPGSDFTKGDTIVEYTPPGPLKSSNNTRMIYLLYKQPNGKITVDVPYTESREAGIRPFWSIKKFVDKYDLGDPVALLGLLTVYDDFVPILHKEFMSFKKSKA